MKVKQKGFYIKYKVSVKVLSKEWKETMYLQIIYLVRVNFQNIYFNRNHHQKLT